jgi:hypothetical protein
MVIVIRVSGLDMSSISRRITFVDFLQQKGMIRSVTGSREFEGDIEVYDDPVTLKRVFRQTIYRKVVQ